MIWGTAHKMKSHSGCSHQPVAVESGVHTPKEEPAWPQVLQSEFKDEICQQHQCPYHHTLQEGVRTGETQRNYKKSINMAFKCQIYAIQFEQMSNKFVF